MNEPILKILRANMIVRVDIKDLLLLCKPNREDPDEMAAARIILDRVNDEIVSEESAMLDVAYSIGKEEFTRAIALINLVLTNKNSSISLLCDEINDQLTQECVA